MKLLFLTPYLPSPPRTGGSRRLHGLISGLAKSHEVSVLSLVRPDESLPQAFRATREYCQEVVAIPNSYYQLPKWRKRLLQAGAVTSPISWDRLLFQRPALQAGLDEMLARSYFDVITCEFAQMAFYRYPSSTTLVLDAHNVEYEVLYRTYRVERHPTRKLFSYLNYRKLRREERAIWAKFDGCAVTSARDERVVRREYPTLPTAVVPNAVDTGSFRPAQFAPEPERILFFGAMDYYPNVDGLLFFLQEVLPQIRRRYPNAQLDVVGQLPPASIRAWASESVNVTGLVEDVRPYIDRASVVVVPLRIGGGTRLKVVEAMASGKAIVSTPLGAEGIAVRSGREILLADTAEAFAAAVVRLLTDTALTHRLGEAARRLAVNRYDWKSSVAALEGFYRELLERPDLPEGGPSMFQLAHETGQRRV
jgi:glycosyltransferase involved in cell wall biosynthesis